MGGAIQGTPLVLTKTVSTFYADPAFSGGGLIGLPPADPSVQGITTDGTNIYVTVESNSTIRKLAIASGTVETLAGTAGTYGSADGKGPSARFSNPKGITTDGTNLFVADTGNHTVRKVVLATGEVTTLAGTAGLSGLTDGTEAAARFGHLEGITSDGRNLFVTDFDTGGINNAIRKVVIATGEVTTLAGGLGLPGSADGRGSAAKFDVPAGITTDGTNLFVCDTYNSTIRKVVIATGEVTTLVGTAGVSGSTDGVGSAARFDQPVAISTDGTNLFVTDYGSNTIRKVVIASRVVTTLAGAVGSYGSIDGTGTTARFARPRGITNDGSSLFGLFRRIRG
jgi:hypothetical protein